MAKKETAVASAPVAAGAAKPWEQGQTQGEQQTQPSGQDNANTETDQTAINPEGGTVNNSATQETKTKTVEPVAAEEADPFVTVTVPKRFGLCLAPHVVKQIGPGVRQMRLSEAEHWYSKANGVTIYKPE